MEQAEPHEGHGIDLGFAAADEGHVGVAALDGAGSFSQRQAGGGLPAGNGVGRPLRVVKNRDVAGQHVRQIFEQPERRDVFHPGSFGRVVRFAPAGKVERVAGSPTLTHGGGQFIQVRADQPSRRCCTPCAWGRI